ncbi:MAG: hypothetical protein LBR71_02515 [Synergistaceae bacterium]|nr:hypothetical protein [Synergistaceae bacterium]
MNFGRLNFRKLKFLAIAVLGLLSGRAAWAGVPQDVARLFELNAKIRPGMTIDAINALLDFPAREDKIGNGSPAITRCMWLHGEMGVEAYAVEGSAYNVSMTLPCKDAAGALKAMDALTRQGASKYGQMPQFDRATSEYYWARDGIRFAFSKYDKTTVLTRCTKVLPPR